MKIPGLYSAITEVLESHFVEELESYLSEDEFGRTTKGSLIHRFEEWIVELVRTQGDVKSLVDSMGTRTGNMVLQKMVGERPKYKRSELVSEFGDALGIPKLHINGCGFYLKRVKEFQDELNEGRTDYESVASRLRQDTERLLREVALLANASGLTEAFQASLLNNSNLRLPRNTPTVAASLNKECIERLILDENWGDLGFLNILVGKAGKAVRRGDHPGVIEPLKKNEAKAINELTSALQDYTHFKPSQKTEREQKLKDALTILEGCIEGMESRGAIPRAAVLLTRECGYFGQTYSGRDASGTWVTLRTDEDLPLGVRILFREVSNPVHRLAGWARADRWE